MRSWSLLRLILLGWAFVPCVCGRVLAQQTAPGGVEGTGLVINRPLWIEGAITVAMIALVLYVVCRNSNRT